MRAAILAIGDELVFGQTVDTNSAWLSAQLTAMGITTAYHQTVGDDLDAIAAAIGAASKDVELVLITGGLGPTDDDLTRQALAKAMGVELVEHGPSLAAIQSFFQSRNRAMPARNRLQAMHPRGSTVIPNPNGTAPGIRATLNRATIYVTPGVPREMFEMFRSAIAPDINKKSPAREVILTAKLNCFGMGESTVADRLGPLMDRARNPKVGTTVSAGVVSVRIRSEFSTTAEAQSQLDATVYEVSAALGSILFSRDDQTLQQVVVALLKERGKTVTTAESCTGGLIGKMLTDVPGSSDIYRGGWIVYANAMKERELGVPANVLTIHGAVSEPVALAMAAGAERRAGAGFALAVTGIAGPGGGTPDKPIGTVWIALAGPGAEQNALLFNLPGDRDMVRELTAKASLQLLRFKLLGVPLTELTWGKRPTTREVPA